MMLAVGYGREGLGTDTISGEVTLRVDEELKPPTRLKDDDREVVGSEPRTSEADGRLCSRFLSFKVLADSLRTTPSNKPRESESRPLRASWLAWWFLIRMTCLSASS